MSASEAPRLTSHEWGVLFVLCGAIFLEGIDISMMGVALPSIRAELGLPTADLQWVVTAYALGYGGFVLLGGRAADLLGRRRMFVTWLVVFLAFSGLGGLATEGWILILARFATGVAAGFLTPAGLSIITTMFAEGPRRDRALLVYAGTAAGGFSLGMVTGGLLTAMHWRWVFFAPVVVAAVLLVVAIRMLPRQDAAPGGRFDIAGSVTLTVGMLVLVLAIVRAPDVSATGASSWAGLALAALAYALFLPLTADGSYRLMLPALLVLGVAFALAYGPLTIAATDGVDEHEQGLAGGILTTSFQFGAALGLAVVTAVVVTASGGGPLSYDALRAGLLVALAAAVLGVVVTAPGLRTHARATT
jgi:MFS family permease